MIYVTGDNHFDHFNIINHATRPFKDLDKMNGYMFDKWNDVVNDDDLVIITGDFAWGKDKERFTTILEVLNGHKVLLKGSHDRARGFSLDEDKGLDDICKKYELNVEGFDYPILLRHTPVEDIYCTYRLVICSHVHRKWLVKMVGDMPASNKIMNINCGVDMWGYEPVPITEIIKIYEKYYYKLRIGEY